MKITFPDSKSDKISKLLDKMKMLDNEIYSITDQINKAPLYKKTKITDNIYYLLEKGKYYRKLSENKFDITIATITSLYGFPEGPYKIPDEDTLKTHAGSVGLNNLKYTKKNVYKKTELKIDMGAYAKGYIVDRVKESAVNAGVTSAMINAGGDLYALGSKGKRKWHVAIKKPDKKGSYLSIIGLKDKAVATSGNYERYFVKNGERYNHIFNADTHNTANNYKSISVIADSVEKADGLSTVYYLLKIDHIKKMCSKLKTPVLVYTPDSKKITLCGWQDYEVSN